MASKIKITSGKGNEFYNKFQLGDETYEAVTEDLGARKAQIITRIDCNSRRQIKGRCGNV